MRGELFKSVPEQTVPVEGKIQGREVKSFRAKRYIVHQPIDGPDCIVYRQGAVLVSVQYKILPSK